MRIRLPFLLFACLAVLDLRTGAQQIAPLALQLLQASLVAQTGQVTVQDVTLSGTVQYVAGSDDETVPITLQAIAAGSARSGVSLAAGALTETRQLKSTGPSGSWSNGNGVSHSMVGHNLMTDAAWFFPLFIVQRLLSDPNAVVSYLGNGGGTLHLQAVKATPSNLSGIAATQLQHLSQIDLYLDAASFEPVGLGFNIHPDNNALIDIPVYIQFSNYQQTNGVSVPMHIQKYVNSTLALDIQVQDAVFNTGLSQSSFAAQ